MTEVGRRTLVKSVLAFAGVVGLGELELGVLEAPRVRNTQGVYITSFGPYGGIKRNSTQDITDHLADLGYQTETLPVDDTAPIRFRKGIQSNNPRLII